MQSETRNFKLFRFLVNSLMYTLNNAGHNSNPVSLRVPEKEILFFYCQFYCKRAFCVHRYNKIISFTFFHARFSRAQAHNRNVLSVDYSQESRVGKIYDDHRKFTLRVQYDDQGRPVLWTPSKYNQVRVSYSNDGLVTGIQRGNWTERRDYDNGRIITRTWANGKIWSYTFLEKVYLKFLLYIYSLRPV